MSIRLMTEKTLNAKKGWPQMAAVDFSAVFAPAIVTEVLPGSVVHLNSSQQYELGVGDLAVMPMFTFESSTEPGAVNDGGDPTVQKGGWVGITPGAVTPGHGKTMALVAVGAYELVSTSFVVGPTYQPNDLLTSALAGPTAGLLAPGVLGTDTICGMVAQGVINNGYGHNGLSFWPVLFPVYPAAAGEQQQQQQA